MPSAIFALCASEIFAVAKVKCCHAAALEVLKGCGGKVFTLPVGRRLGAAERVFSLE